MARRPVRGASVRRAVARQSVVSNALPVLALGSVPVALVAPRLSFLGSLGDLLTGAAAVMMVGTSWGLLARRLGRRGVLWEAIAVAGLVVIGWLAVSNMLAAALPGGLTTANRLLVTALLPLGCVLFLDDEPLLFDPSKRPGARPLAVAVACFCVAVAAITANVLSERVWLRPDGPALYVENLPVRTLILANRTPGPARYRILVEGAQRRIDQTVTLPGESQGALSLDRLGAGPAQVSVFDLDEESDQPIRRLSLTELTLGGTPATPSPTQSGTGGDGAG